MTIYIVISGTWNDIESVWDTREAAESALLGHARTSNIQPMFLLIVERKLNQFKQESE